MARRKLSAAICNFSFQNGNDSVWYQITCDVLPDNLGEYRNVNGEQRK